MSAKKTRLFFKLQLASHLMQKIADRELSAKTRLTTPQMAVLSLLANGEAITQRQISIALRQNESAVTSMVTRLERLEYLTRRKSKTDRRSWELKITEKGLSSLEATKKPFGKINKLIELELSTAEVLELAELLERLALRAADYENLGT